MSDSNLSQPFPSMLTVPVLTNTDPLPKAIIPPDVTHANEPGRRPEIYKETLGADQFGIIEKPLTTLERMFNQGWLRKLLLFVEAPVALYMAHRALRGTAGEQPTHTTAPQPVLR